jgi:hypothetical protein
MVIVEVTRSLPYVYGDQTGIHLSAKSTTALKATTSQPLNCRTRRRAKSIELSRS